MKELPMIPNVLKPPLPLRPNISPITGSTITIIIITFPENKSPVKNIDIK